METRAIAALTGLFQSAVQAADPLSRLPQFLPPKPKGKLIVVGAGKASARMAEAVEAHYDFPLNGTIVTRYGYGRPTRHLSILEAAHPVPDEAGIAATNEILALTQNLTEDDLVIALISGGGSALFCAPIDGMSLAQMQDLNQQLLNSGAPISVMNEIRQYFSRVKGGRFVSYCAPAKVLGLLISDVPGDDIGLIASGPTAPPVAPTAALTQLLEKHAINLPKEIIATALNANIAQPDMSRVENHIIAAPSQSLNAAKEEAEAMGFDVEILGDAIEGEARDVGAQHARLALEKQAMRKKGDRPLVLLSGGECTVTRRGDGIGGPNAEYVLGALIELNGHEDIYVLSADTDGVDGAAEIAGAFATPTGLQKAKAKGVIPQDLLDRNDAHSFFKQISAQLITGPTLTNVNDFRAALIYPPE